MTYLLLNAIFLLITAALLLALRKHFPKKSWLPTLFVMVLLTAVFDNLIIGTGIVAYDPTKISGFMVFLAPVEDFAYTVVAALLLPTIWNYFRRKSARD